MPELWDNYALVPQKEARVYGQTPRCKEVQGFLSELIQAADDMVFDIDSTNKECLRRLANKLAAFRKATTKAETTT